ncbi:MAG: hypothetical protein V1672_01850 [Candidatus Diapherotrites archaeon]
MPKRINFFQRVREGFGNLFVSAEEKRRRAKARHDMEKAKYFATTGKTVHRSKTNKEAWTSNELRGFQTIATDELVSEHEPKSRIQNIEKTKALENEIERRGTKIITMDDTHKKEIMAKHNTYLKNAKSYESQGKLALAENFYIRAAKMSELMGDKQQASELEKIAEQLREKIIQKIKAERQRN